MLLRIKATCNRVQGHHLVSGKLAAIPSMGFSCPYRAKFKMAACQGKSWQHMPQGASEQWRICELHYL